MNKSADGGRRAFIKGVVATLALQPDIGLAKIAIDDTLPLLKAVVISRADLASAGGIVAFDAWFESGGRERLVGGLLLNMAQILPSRPPKQSLDRTIVAYVSNCPHEACQVRLESDPEIIAKAANGASIPSAVVLFCPCHFSMFDIGNDGSRFVGPAYRGLYRFKTTERGGSIIVDRVERAVVELF